MLKGKVFNQVITNDCTSQRRVSVKRNTAKENPL